MTVSRVAWRFRLATLPTVRAPAVLFHGTRADLQGPPKGPAWFTPSETIAESYAVEHGQGWIYTFKTKGSPKLARVLSDEDARSLLSSIDWPMHERMKPIVYFVSGYYSEKLASSVCKAGFGGWLVERRTGRTEIMLCEPNSHLTFVSRRDTTESYAGD